MASDSDDRGIAALVQLVGELVRKGDETRDLVARFGRKEIDGDYVVRELASRFELDLGAALRALAAHDAETARQLGERLRHQLEADPLLRSEGPVSAPLEGGSTETASAPSKFKDRDDDVLRREYVVLKLLSQNNNQEFRTGEIHLAARAAGEGEKLSEGKLTAHLTRLVQAGVIARERKGRYRSAPPARAQLLALANEIESRQLTVPKLPDNSDG